MSKIITNHNSIENLPQWCKKAIQLDTCLLIIFNLIMFILFTQIEAGEHLIENLQKHEKFELDELIPLFMTITLSLLLYTVRRFFELKKLFAKIEQISIRDHLTGLYNRRYIQKRYDDVNESAKNDNKTFSAIIIDIDDFKKINDNYGHNIGDDVLDQFAKIILSSTRSLDIVSRWGGEEFLILCPHTDLFSASKAAERIITAIRAFNFDRVGYVTASLGIVVADKDESFESIVNRADKCLYHAKNSGKNCYKSS